MQGNWRPKQIESNSKRRKNKKNLGVTELHALYSIIATTSPCAFPSEKREIDREMRSWKNELLNEIKLDFTENEARSNECIKCHMKTNPQIFYRLEKKSSVYSLTTRNNEIQRKKKKKHARGSR